MVDFRFPHTPPPVEELPLPKAAKVWGAAAPQPGKFGERELTGVTFVSFRFRSLYVISLYHFVFVPISITVV